MICKVTSSPVVDCKHTDLGLCYVSKFEIKGEVVYGISPQSYNTNQRMDNEKKSLAEAGYYIIEGTEQ